MQDRSFPDPPLVFQCGYATEKGPIWKYIEWLDGEGMEAIKTVRRSCWTILCSSVNNERLISDSRGIH